MQQAWCENLTFNDILDENGNFKKIEEYPLGKRPVFYENSAIENALEEFIKNVNTSVARPVWSVIDRSSLQ